VKQMTPRN